MSAAALTELRISSLCLLRLANSRLWQSPSHKVNTSYSSFSCEGVEIPPRRFS